MGLKLLNLSQKVLVGTMFHELVGDFNHICTDITMGLDEELIGFW